MLYPATWIVDICPGVTHYCTLNTLYTIHCPVLVPRLFNPSIGIIIFALECICISSCISTVVALVVALAFAVARETIKTYHHTDFSYALFNLSLD